MNYIHNDQHTQAASVLSNKNSMFHGFDAALQDELAELLHQNDATEISNIPQINGFWLMGDNEETELRILRLGSIQITVSRVSIINKRRGCMSKIFQKLVDYAQTNGIQRICIQCVNTAEMAAWCEHRGLRHNSTFYHMVEGHKTGDYILDVKDQ